MAFTEFYVQTTGSNLNAGSTTADAASLTYASGTWVQSTGVFTVASGDPVADGVAVGDFASVYPDAATVSPFVGRVTARTSTTITVSLTAKSGTAPVDGTTNTTLKIGGAWKGPNGAEAFPFGFAQGTMTDSSGNLPRINFKSGTEYAITAAMTHSNVGPMVIEGYTSSPGDGGRAEIDGGTSGASYVLLTVNTSRNCIKSFLFNNNGASGSANGVAIGSSFAQGCFERCVFTAVRGTGFSSGAPFPSTPNLIECEAYACNQSNSANFGGFAGVMHAVRCISHDNTGSNSNGFVASGAGGLIALFKECIADSNTLHGFFVNQSTSTQATGCSMYNSDAYNNGGDGLRFLNAGSGGQQAYIENSNFLKNGGYGINQSTVGTGGSIETVFNCGFGSGTEANTSGQTNNLSGNGAINSVTYASNVTPWVDQANGDFRINLAAAKGAGRGSFTQTASSYAGTVAYPDIGAAQHQDSGSGGGMLFPRSMNGGLV